MDMPKRNVFIPLSILFFGIPVFMIVMRYFEGKPITWNLVVFGFVFAAVLVSFAFLFDYFFGEKIRKNPKISSLVIGIIWLILAFGNSVNLVRSYILGRRIDWLFFVITILFLFSGVSTLRRSIKK